MNDYNYDDDFDPRFDDLYEASYDDYAITRKGRSRVGCPTDEDYFLCSGCEDCNYQIREVD